MLMHLGNSAVLLLLFLILRASPPAFSSAVDWEERWIQGVLAFHVALFVFFLLTRKHFGAQVP